MKPTKNSHIIAIGSGLAVVLFLLAVLWVMGCSAAPQQRRSKADEDYTLSIPNRRTLVHGCTTVMSFPHVEKNGVVIPAQSLLRCEDNELAMQNDETGRMYRTDGTAWMP